MEHDNREIPQQTFAADQSHVKLVVGCFAVPALAGLIVMVFGIVALAMDVVDADDTDFVLLELVVLSLGGIVCSVCVGVMYLAIKPRQQ